MLRLASLASALALVGCVDTGDEGMFVLNNTSTIDLESCALTGDPQQAFLGHGVIDAAATYGYVLTPLVKSRVSVGVEETPDPVQKTILITGADVTVELKSTVVVGGAPTQHDTSLGSFTTLFSAGLEPDSTINAFLEALPPSFIRQAAQAANAGTEAFQAEVLATVTIRGTLGDKEVESTPFSYPITVCNDCIRVNRGACLGLVLDDPRTGNVCNPYQDGVVDCCTDDAGGLVCPAVPVAAP